MKLHLNLRRHASWTVRKKNNETKPLCLEENREEMVAILLSCQWMGQLPERHHWFEWHFSLNSKRGKQPIGSRQHNCSLEDAYGISPEPVNMLPYMAKGIFQEYWNEDLEIGEIILYCPDGPNLISLVLKVEKLSQLWSEAMTPKAMTIK